MTVCAVCGQVVTGLLRRFGPVSGRGAAGDSVCAVCGQVVTGLLRRSDRSQAVERLPLALIPLGDVSGSAAALLPAGERSARAPHHPGHHGAGARHGPAAGRHGGAGAGGEPSLTE